MDAAAKRRIYNETRSHKRKEARKIQNYRVAAAQRYSTDADNQHIIDECCICREQNVVEHKQCKNMCQQCGNLYRRYRTAKNKGTKDLPNLSRQLLQRCSSEPNLKKYPTFRAELIMEERNMTKTCKQCGRVLDIEAFRQYTPRGKGIYSTTQGYHTVCKACENFNQLVNVAYNKEERTEAQEELLAKAATLYKTLQERGLEPKGRYAAQVLGTVVASKRPSTIDDYIESLTGDTLMREYEQLLDMPLVDTPDAYHDMLDELRERSVGSDNKVLGKYVDIYDKVLSRFDNYEDNYDW